MLIIGMILGGAGIYFTNTRGIWLAFAAALVTLTVFRSQMRKPALAVIGLVLITFVLGVGSKFSLWEGTLFSRRQSTVELRAVNYEIALSVFAENPIFGVGYGIFSQKLEEYSAIQGAPNNRLLTDGNHSTFLGLLAEVGTIGMISFLAVYYCILRMCLRVYKEGENSFEKNLAVAVIAMLMSFFVMGAVSDFRFHKATLNLMFFFFGIAASLEARLRGADFGKALLAERERLPSVNRAGVLYTQSHLRVE